MKKTCFKCGIEKDLSQFYKHKAMSDGHLGKCKDCAKLDANLHRKNNLEQIREYDRNRGNLEHRRRAAIETTFRRRKEVDGYTAAHCAVARAIKTGVLTRGPCQFCGSIENIHGHHDNYNEPLAVIWLCAIHHKARHAFLEHIGCDTF